MFETNTIFCRLLRFSALVFLTISFLCWLLVLLVFLVSVFFFTSSCCCYLFQVSMFWFLFMLLLVSRIYYGFGHLFSKKRFPLGKFDAFQGSWGWPGEEVTKDQTKHSSTLRLEGFASNSHPLQNTIFIGISGDSENRSSKGPTRHHKCHFSSRFRAFLGEQQAPTGEIMTFCF